MSLRRRLVALFLCSLVVGGILLGNDLLESFRKASSEVAENMMHEFAAALASQVESGGGVANARRQLEPVFQTYHAKRADRPEAVALQAYVTDANGIVIYSSRDPSEVGRDYRQWNDVFLTLQGKYGARSTRRERKDPLTSIYYVAAPILARGKVVGVVSVIKSEESIAPFLARALNRALPLAALLLALLSLFSVLVMMWITRPIHRLRDYALGVSQGLHPVCPELSPKELRELLEAFEKMRLSLEGKRAIETYVQGLIHELKSPLTAIQGAAELSLEVLPDAQRERFLKNILREGKRVHVLLEELLRLARLESQVRLARLERVEMQEVVDDVFQAFESVSTQRKVKLQCACHGPGNVQGDRLHLEQAVRNLVGNALAFSPRGGIVRVEIQGSSEGVALLVRDQGPGVPEFARARIFERFYSLDRPDGAARGSGLGLNYAREVLLLHRGKLELLPSAVDEGACFRVWIPRPV